MHYGVPGVHLAICQCTGELVVCGQLVEYWRDDHYFAAGDGLPLFLCLGASQREGKEGQGCMSVKKSGIGEKQPGRHRRIPTRRMPTLTNRRYYCFDDSQEHEQSCGSSRANIIVIPEYSTKFMSGRSFMSRQYATPKTGNRHPNFPATRLASTTSLWRQQQIKCDNTSSRLFSASFSDWSYCIERILLHEHVVPKKQVRADASAFEFSSS